MEDGVWRTIAGRRVFIKKGQSLSEAMKASGKFNSKERYQQRQIDKKNEAHEKLREEVGDKYKDLTPDELKEKLQELQKNLNDPMYKYLNSEDDVRQATKEVKFLKKEIKDLTVDERKKEELFQQKQRDVERSKQSKLDAERVSKMTPQDINDLKRTKLTDEETKRWDEKFDAEIKSLENKELYIPNDELEDLINDDNLMKSRYQDIELLYEHEKISKEEYNKYFNANNQYREEVGSILYDKLRNKGYELETLPGGNMAYTQRYQIQTGYNQMLDYLDKKKVKYEISRSTNAGIVPSIYIKDKDGDIIARIGNHKNSNMNHLEKVFDNASYLTWKKDIIDEIDLH